MIKLALLASMLVAVPAMAQPYPKIIPSPGGETIVPNERHQRNYDEYKFAPARRAGDTLYISGVIAGPIGEEGRDAEAFRLQVRRAFVQIQRTLQAAGVGFDDVAMINSFHVWDGPGFKGTRDEQFAIISAVKDEFMKPPHPAWTAVGTTGLLRDNGVVEIQMIAHAPRKDR